MLVCVKEGDNVQHRFIDVRNLKELVKSDAVKVTFALEEGERTVHFAYQKTGYGQKRFFLCPQCGKRTVHLYIVKGNLKCRMCSGVKRYEGIQNNTKGGYDEIGYRMQKYAARHDIVFDFPFDYTAFIFDTRTSRKKFSDALKILQALENMRFHALFFKSRYKPSVIKSVVTMQHPLIQSATLKELKNNIYDWNTGDRVVIPESDLSSFVKGAM